MAARGSKPVETRILTADEIMDADDRPTKIVPVPEWGEGVGVKIQALSKQQQIDCKKASRVGNMIDEDLFDLHLFGAAVVEPKLTQAQVEGLRAKNSHAIDRVIGEIVSLSGMDAEAIALVEKMFRDGQ